MYVCVRVCPRLLKTIHVKRSLNITNQTSPTAFFIMALAVDITDGRGLSKEACHELLLKKSKVMPC